MNKAKSVTSTSTRFVGAACLYSPRYPEGGSSRKLISRILHNHAQSERGERLARSSTEPQPYMLWWRIKAQEDGCKGPLGRYVAWPPGGSKAQGTTRAELPCPEPSIYARSLGVRALWGFSLAIRRFFCPAHRWSTSCARLSPCVARRRLSHVRS
jgi:hypothetical protein